MFVHFKRSGYFENIRENRRHRDVGEPLGLSCHTAWSSFAPFDHLGCSCRLF